MALAVFKVGLVAIVGFVAFVGASQQVNDDVVIRRGIRQSEMDKVSRARASRVDTIREQIETMLHVRGKDLPAASAADVEAAAEAFKALPVTMPSATSAPQEAFFYSDYAEKLQSMFPECQLPRRVHRHLPRDPSTGHLFFRVRKSKADEGFTIRTISARLRLYYHNERNHTDDIEQQHNDSSLAFHDESKFRVTVSVVRRGRRGHAKEHVMLDSKMVPRFGSRWLFFDVLSAVTAWQDKPASNLGLIIEVEDEEMSRRNAFQFVKPINCEEVDDSSVAFPSVLDSSSEQSNSTAPSDTASRFFNTGLFPMLDVGSVEIPDADVLAMSASSSLLGANDALTHSEEESNMGSEKDPAGAHDTAVLDFPVLNNLHVLHHSQHPLPAAHHHHHQHHHSQRQPKQLSLENSIPATEEEDDVSGSSELGHDDFDLLEKLEEINFLRRDHHVSPPPTETTATSESPSVGQKVVLSHGQMISALRAMLGKQRQDIETESEFLNALAREEDESEAPSGDI